MGMRANVMKVATNNQKIKISLCFRSFLYPLIECFYNCYCYSSFMTITMMIMTMLLMFYSIDGILKDKPPKRLDGRPSDNDPSTCSNVQQKCGSDDVAGGVVVVSQFGHL